MCVDKNKILWYSNGGLIWLAEIRKMFRIINRDGIDVTSFGV